MAESPRLHHSWLVEDDDAGYGQGGSRGLGGGRGGAARHVGDYHVQSADEEDTGGRGGQPSTYGTAPAQQQRKRAGKLPQINYMRQVTIMSVAFFLIFMAFNTAQALETSVVTSKWLSHTCLAVLYGAFTLSSVVAPRVVRWLGPRYSNSHSHNLPSLHTLTHTLTQCAHVLPQNIHDCWGSSMYVQRKLVW